MAERMDPKPLEDFSIMMCVTHPQPCDLDVLRELVGELTQMSTQKTAGQRGGKDLSWDNLERVKMVILCEAVSLVNSGQLDEMEAALRAQQETENLWHDAKTNPPKNPGLYYGRKDNTNSMWLCQYRDGVWTLDMYPEQEMPVVQWAEYSSFSSGQQSKVEAEKNEPLTLQEVAQAYLEICGNDCVGDDSVGIPCCQFYDWPDVDDDAHPCLGECRLSTYCHKPKEESKC